MNIWKAYCNPDCYNIYFDLLKAKGMKAEETESLKEQFCVYLQRIKHTCFASELNRIETRKEFLEKLKDIFYVKWAGRVMYQTMPYHYERYLHFLDTMQAFHNDFINDEEKRRLINPNFDIPIAELTEYEKEYLVGDKLVALTNPQLLYILKEYIETRGMNPDRLTLVCKDFYEGHLPNMDSEDYAKLIAKLWSPARKVKKGGGRNKFQITFPDGCVEQYSILEGAMKVVNFYGFDEIYKFKPQIRGTALLVNYVIFGQEKDYKEIGKNQYIRYTGNYKDYLNVLRLINVHYGRQLKIEMC